MFGLGSHRCLFVLRFMECPFPSITKVSADSGTNDDPPAPASQVDKTRHRVVRIEDRRLPKGARGPVRSRLC